MRVERALLEELPEKKFNIGYQGEQNHTQVIISCPLMFRDYPDAVASMVVKPPQGDLYPVSLTRDGNDLTWDVSDADVAIPGEGILQLTFTDGEGEEAEIIKTVYGSYSVNASLVANGEAPDPMQSWLDEAGAALATFENEIGDIRKITTATDADEGKALSPKTVTNGKVTEWEYIDLADPDVVTQAVDDWLDDHPEATTTVQDGAITEAKLNSTLKDDLAWQTDVDGLMSAITQEKAPVILDTATGEIVTVPDGADGMAVETLMVAIEPVQDLHGYDNPWPAGGGKNFGKQIPSKTDVGITATLLNNGTVLVDGTATGYFYTESIFTLEAGSYLVSRGSNAGVSNVNVQIRDASTDALLCTATNTGASITFSEDKQIKFRIAINNTATVANVVVEPMIRLSSVSDSTFAPYSNLCPISGWDSANVSRTGKNLLTPPSSGGTYNGITFTVNSDGTVTADTSGSASTGLTNLECGRIYLVTGETYKIKASIGGAGNTYRMRGVVRDANGTAISIGGTLFQDAYNGTDRSIIIPDNASYMDVYISVDIGQTLSNVKFEPMVCFASVPNMNYEPYNAQKKTYTFPNPPGTVYGGTLTVNSDGTGTLMVDEVSLTFDGSLDESWFLQSINSYNIANFGMGIASNSTKLAITNFLKRQETVIAQTQDEGFHLNGTTFYVRINSSRASTVEELQAYLQSNNLQLVRSPSSSSTYTLTAEAVSLLLGVNNMWADCGNVSIQYPCDTRLFIERLTAPTEDDMIANANISSGKFFMVGNNLYISTSAIAQGETITPGTNCTTVSLADALNQINQ